MRVSTERLCSLRTWAPARSSPSFVVWRRRKQLVRSGLPLNDADQDGHSVELVEGMRMETCSRWSGEERRVGCAAFKNGVKAIGDNRSAVWSFFETRPWL